MKRTFSRLELLVRRFPAAVRQRGQDYFISGAVGVTATEDTWTAAKVRGTGGTYEARFDFFDHKTQLRCTCSFFLRERQPCKHLWATLLALVDSGIPPLGRPGEGLPSEHPAPEPPWKTRLTAISAAVVAGTPPHPAPRGRELAYVIDAAAAQGTTKDIVLLLAERQKKTGRSRRTGFRSGITVDLSAPEFEIDRRIIAALNGAKVDEPLLFYGGAPPRETYRASVDLQPVLIPMLVETGRCYLQTRKNRGQPARLTWDGERPWTVQLVVQHDPERADWVVTGSLVRGEEQAPLGDPALFLTSGFLVMAGRVARFENPAALPWVEALKHDPCFRVPERAGEELLGALLRTPEPLPLQLPEELAWPQVGTRPIPFLRVESPKRLNRSESMFGSVQLRCHLEFIYGEARVTAGARGWAVLDPDHRCVHRRDLQFETEAQRRTQELGVRWQGDAYPDSDAHLRASALAMVVATLTSDGWRVEAEGRLYRPPGKVQLHIRSGVDWFDLEGGANFGGVEVPLPKILSALQRGEQSVVLDDGSHGVLPQAWLKRYGLLAQFGTVEGPAIRFGRGQVGLLDALVATEPQADVDPAFRRARKALARFRKVRPVSAPPGFRGSLRPYQCEGLGWMHFLEDLGLGGCLADDMGLGKTVQVLALLEERRGKHTAARGRLKKTAAPSLVVAPLSVVFNWRQEAARFAPELQVLDHTGADRTKKPEGFAGYDVVLTTYGTLRRDVLLFKQAEFDYVILDESQAIKNPGTGSAKAVRLLHARQRLALSGTPIENHVGELWALFDFLNPGMLGRLGGFQKRIHQEDPGHRAILASAVRPFLLRRTKEHVVQELPRKFEQTLYCELDPEQRALCDQLRDYYRTTLLGEIERQGLGGSKIKILEALLRLRQAACHPGLLDPERRGQPSGKLEVLLERLTEVLDEGHKALVFSQFTSFLAILRDRLDKRGVTYEYLDGRTRDRAARVQRFQEDPDCGLFLISLKAGGLGLNLTAAEYVFLLDPWWNPAVEAQAVDRAHRIGQTRQVFAYRLISRGTVEEKVLALQQTKRKLADEIIAADQGLIRHLKKEDLELLLSPN